jgi:5-methylcytosine-specific restriction endonuclease McrA
MKNGRPSRAKGLEDLKVPTGEGLTRPEARIARELIANGYPVDFWTLKPLIEQQCQLESALKTASRAPSVPRLVMDEQRRYWREHPEAKREHDRQWAQASWWLEYQTNPDLRLYIRQKSKRRKALLREQTAHQITPKQLRARFAQFGNCCAYCGAAGDMQIEHVVPISRGGTHAIGNILPACLDCNYSKRNAEVERWYRSQPQFCEKRWRKICRVLGWDRSAVGQLALL